MILLICFTLAVIIGIYLSNRVTINAATDFIETIPEKRVAKMVREAVTTSTVKKELSTSQPTQNVGTMQSGGSDPRSQTAQKGVLGITSGQIKRKSVVSADIFGKSGFATRWRF